MTKVKKLATSAMAKVSAVAGTAGMFLFGLRNPAFAQSFSCDESSFLPCYIQEIMSKIVPSKGGDPNTYINDRVKTGLTILFVVVFIVAIIYSALAAIKFISSQGDASKLEESKGAVKAILMGFAAMLVAIIGLFVILYVLGTTEVPDEQIDVEV
jgi:hypothetical protein